MHRLSPGRLVGVLAIIIGLVLTPIPARAETPPTAASCVQAGNVWVQIESGSTIRGGCATAFGTGMEALSSAGFTVTQNGGFITKIDNQPTDAGPRAWWSYWHKDTDPAGAFKAWEFSNLGAAAYKPNPGSVEAWVVQADYDGTTMPPSQDPVAGVVIGGTPKITRQPAPQSVVEGATATFTVEAGGLPAPSLQWLRLTGDVWTPIPDATTETLTVTASKLDDGAQFRVRATNPSGSIYSIAVRLTINDPGASITIPDAGLRACVADAAGVSEDKLTQAAVEPIKTLSCVNTKPTKIADLTGIGHLTGLNSLIVSTNAISDLTPLAGSKGLAKLWFPGNQVTDLSPIGGLSSLTDVVAGRNQLTSLAPIAGLTAMTDLSVDYNKLTNLTGVGAMTQLTRLVANQNQITSLAPVAALPKLATLAALNNKISDVTPLASKSSLRSVILASNQISDVTPLAGLVELTNLDLGSNAIADVSSLSGLTKLGYLGLKARFQTITQPPAQIGTPVALPVLKDRAGQAPAYLRASGTGASEVTLGDGTVTYAAVRDAYTITFSDTASSPNGQQFGGTIKQAAVDVVAIPDAKFRACLNGVLGQAADAPITSTQAASITEVDCFYAGVTDLTGAERLTSLVTLKLELSDVTNVTPLADLSSLRTLSLDGNKVADVAPLAGLTSLRELDLDGNRLATFDSLAPLVGLEVLTVNNQGGKAGLAPDSGAVVKPTSVAPLAGLTKLTSLTAYANRLADLTGAEALTSLTSLNLHSNGIVNLAPLAALKSLTELNLTTNQISEVAPIAGLTGLVKLTLSKNPISDASALKALVNLTELTFTDAKLTNVDFVRDMAKLSAVYLHSNQLTDLSPLGGKTLRSWGALKQVAPAVAPVEAGLAEPLPTFTDVDGTVFTATAPRSGATVAEGRITWPEPGSYTLAFANAAKKFTGSVVQQVTPAKPRPTVTVTVTAEPTATATVTATTQPSPAPTVTVTHTVTVSASPTSSAPVPGAGVDLYTTPGFHLVNGRRWHTTCEPYSQTIRCRTEIWATQVSQVNGRIGQRTGWVFNNLTYLPTMSQAQWGANPLANPGTHTINGRNWRTECNTATTGAGACRSSIRASYLAATAKPGGGYSYAWTTGWVLNNIVRFKV